MPTILLYMNGSGFVAAAMWFLPALFFANTFYWCIRRFLKNEWLVHFAVILLALFGNVLRLVYSGPCPLALDAAAVGAGFMHVGYTLRESDNKSAKRLLSLSVPEMLAGSLVMLFLIFLNRPVNMRTGSYGVVPLFWVNAIGSTLILWSLSQRAYDFLPGRGSSMFIKLRSVPERIGENSMTYLCFNQVAIFAVFRVFPMDAIGGGVLLHNTIALLIVVSLLYLPAALRGAWDGKGRVKRHGAS